MHQLARRAGEVDGGRSQVTEGRRYAGEEVDRRQAALARLNRVDDGCDPACRIECGNGVIDFGEQCDDGNRIEDDGCDARCRRECGNGIIEGAEECDDGNIVAFDGCDPACRREALPGPGEDCRGFLCAEGLSCFGVAQAGFRNVCTHPCQTNADCADFEVETCCEPPGPQLVDTYCVRRDMLRNGCANEQ